MTPLIAPEIPKGTRDFSPRDMGKRNYVLETMRSVFVNFGYDTIETPALEYAKTIHGKYGDEGTKLTYTFKDHGGRKLALRYDQTVPFARFVASNYRELPLPFKRYQISPVWRADKPAKGRYREFYQCDIDIVGTDSLLAEGEIAKVMVAVFKSLGFEGFVIKLNSRRLVNSILSKLQVPQEKQINVIRSLDKLEKIGKGKVAELLENFVSKQKAGAILDLLSVEGDNEEKLDFLEKNGGDVSQLRKFFSVCQAYEIPRQALKFEASLARGLDYYTGLVFEVILPNVSLGPVCAGGRYDDLCSIFCDEKFSGVGVAFGLDRIVLALEELQLLKDLNFHSQVLVTYFNEETLDISLKIANEFREVGIKSEIYFQPDRLSKQIRYADKKGIPFVVICGPDEAARGEALIKVMKTGKQKQIPLTQLSLYLTGYQG